MGSVGEVLPSRDSTRIAKHTFDDAKIGIISESCKYFAFYFHFLPPRTFNPRDSLYALYDSHNPLFPYFVAKHQACRNNSDKYLAFFLESAKNFLIFAMSIRTNDIWETRNS